MCGHSGRDRGGGSTRLCRSGLHRRGCRQDSGGRMHRATRRQAARSQTRFRPATAALGGRAVLRLGNALPPARQRLRVLCHNTRRLPRHRLSRIHAQARRRTDQRCITLSGRNRSTTSPFTRASRSARRSRFPPPARIGSCACSRCLRPIDAAGGAHDDGEYQEQCDRTRQQGERLQAEYDELEAEHRPAQAGEQDG